MSGSLSRKFTNLSRLVVIEDVVLEIYSALRDFVQFVQFKKREKHTWRILTLSKLQALKVTLLHGCFSRF